MKTQDTSNYNEHTGFFRYEVGFPDDYIGIYEAESEDQAKIAAMSDMQEAGMWTSSHSRQRYEGKMIAKVISY